jgi:hypothetical protein
MELATELLEITNEAELDQFLGKLIRKAGRAVGRAIKSPTGQALGGILKNAAKTTLPVVGGALGTAIGGPAGTALGSQLASLAGQRLGLEFESLDQEDQEFEGARRFVRTVGDAAKKAASIAANVNPRSAAKSVLTAAAKKHAPGLLDLLGEFEDMPAPASTPSSRMMATGNSGRWIRRGQKIVLLGV